MIGTQQDTEHSFRRHWLVPVVLLTSTALLLFFGLYAWDHAHYVTSGRGVVADYFAFDANRLTDAVASLAGIIAAVFGIVITVVSIVVQLSAERFAGVTRMFLRDRVTLGVASFYIVACVCGVWLSVSMRQDYVPRFALGAMLAATTAGLVLMAPYFGYVFWFLEPTNIIQRIRRVAESAVRAAIGELASEPATSSQVRIVRAVEELTDIASNSVAGKDKLIACGAVDALRDFVLSYSRSKPRMPVEWFRLSLSVRSNPDVVAMDPDSLDGLQERRTWVEWKVLRQYLVIFNEALAHAKDMTYLVAINTRYIAESAADAGDDEVVRLVFRFMNSYVRAALNLRDVRTAYNIFNQYRLLVESMIAGGKAQHAREAVEYMIYYGHTSFDMNLPFVTETVAYDVATLCQVAHERQVDYSEALLGLLLELDRPLRSRSQERALLGVRKAQVKLAAFYLANGREDLARKVAHDMVNEPRERLVAIRSALERVASKEFWECTDRGTNFEYLPEAHRERLGEFFSWLGDIPREDAGSLLPWSVR